MGMNKSLYRHTKPHLWLAQNTYKHANTKNPLTLTNIQPSNSIHTHDHTTRLHSCATVLSLLCGYAHKYISIILVLYTSQYTSVFSTFCMVLRAYLHLVLKLWVLKSKCCRARGLIEFHFRSENPPFEKGSYNCRWSSIPSAIVSVPVRPSSTQSELSTVFAAKGYSKVKSIAFCLDCHVSCKRWSRDSKC